MHVLLYHPRIGLRTGEEADRHEADLPDLVYWRQVLEQFRPLNDRLERPVDTVLLTWDDRFDDVRSHLHGRSIAIMLGGSVPRRPTLPGVEHVFRSHPGRPVSPLRLTSPLDGWLFTVQTAKYLRNLVAYGRSIVTAPPVPVDDVPLGIWNHEDAGFIPTEARAFDVSFLGSTVQGRRTPRSVVSTRDIARGKMLRSLDRLARARPEMRIELGLSTRFGAEAPSSLGYTRTLMHSRLALCPMGSMSQTFRFFEALRCGAVPISDRLPLRAPLTGHPGIEVRRWSELPRVVTALLADPGALEARAQACRDFYRAALAPAAVAVRMAADLTERIQRQP